METKVNSAGEQQPMKENGQYTFSNFKSPHKQLEDLKNQLANAKSIFERGKLRKQIAAIEGGFSSVEEYEENNRLKKEQAMKDYEESQRLKKERKLQKEKEDALMLEKEIKSASPHKRKQFEIIQKNNPMLDDYHVGIRSPKDIKTFEETLNDKESFAWGDFSREDAKAVAKTGYITVYSSYDIKQGTFVSTSLVQAVEYAGGKKDNIKKAKVKLEDVAWINGDEGQYAKI